VLAGGVNTSNTHRGDHYDGSQNVDLTGSEYGG